MLTRAKPVRGYKPVSRSVVLSLAQSGSGRQVYNIHRYFLHPSPDNQIELVIDSDFILNISEKTPTI